MYNVEKGSEAHKCQPPLQLFFPWMLEKKAGVQWTTIGCMIAFLFLNFFYIRLTAFLCPNSIIEVEL